MGKGILPRGERVPQERIVIVNFLRIAPGNGSRDHERRYSFREREHDEEASHRQYEITGEHLPLARSECRILWRGNTRDVHRFNLHLLLFGPLEYMNEPCFIVFPQYCRRQLPSFSSSVLRQMPWRITLHSVYGPPLRAVRHQSSTRRTPFCLSHPPVSRLAADTRAHHKPS